MTSEVFDKLWYEAIAHEGDLLTTAFELAHALEIISAFEAIELARKFMEAGRPFFTYCETNYRTTQLNKLDKARRQHALSPYQVEFIKVLISKSAKGL